MTTGVPPIASVASRIRAIEQRFEPAESTSADTVVDPGAAFDPFGDAYQRAVQTRPATGATSATGTAGTMGMTGGWTTGGLAGGQWPATARARLIPGLAGGLDAVGVHTHNASSHAPDGIRPSGGYGPMPVPYELAVYDNGRVPADQLHPISQDGHRLHAPAAAAWDSLVEAAAADGIELRITDSYRSFDQQVDLVRRKGLYSQGGLGATPGTSNHGWGLAVDADVTDPATLDWIRQNGHRFGWVESVPREPWHWEFRPHQA